MLYLLCPPPFVPRTSHCMHGTDFNLFSPDPAFWRKRGCGEEGSVCDLRAHDAEGVIVISGAVEADSGVQSLLS